MKPIWILKTGTTEPTVKSRRGDFEDWIRAGLELDDDSVAVADLANGDALPAITDCRAAILTGSSAMVTDRLDWSVATTEWLRAVDDSIPTLGICYGHQLLAEAFGGKVDWNPNGREIGTVRIETTAECQSDPLLGGLPSPFYAQATHSQSCTQLPPGAVHLAYNAVDPHQAFRIGKRTWGIQFHPEFDADIIGGYLTARADAISADGLDVDAIRSSLSNPDEAPRLLRRFAEIALER